MAAGSQATYRGEGTLCKSAPNRVRTLMECRKGSEPCRSARREGAPACRIYINGGSHLKWLKFETAQSVGLADAPVPEWSALHFAFAPRFDRCSR